MKIFIICVIIVLCLSGCGAQKATTPTAPTEQPAAQVTEATQPEISFDVQIMGDPNTGSVVYAVPSNLDIMPAYRWYVDGEILEYGAGEMLMIPFSAAGKQLQVKATLEGYVAESQPVVVTEKQAEKLPMAAVAHDVKLYGRCGVGATGLCLDYSASGFEMNVNSTGGAISFEYVAQYNAYVAVYIDGKQYDRPLLTEGTGILTIPVSAGTHTIMILKETEINTSGKTLQLMTVDFDGTILEKPANRSLYIEFIGDSISCGDGALGTYTAGQKWSLEDHSGTHGFAYLTAQQLDADWSVFARGGIGLMKPAGNYCAGDLFPYVNLYRDALTKYDPVRVPDIVVVELGANDDKNDTAGFVAAYNQLVDQIRTTYGQDVKIVWTGKNYNQYNAAQYVAKQREDANMFAFQFNYGGSGSAALDTQTSGHPNAEEQQAYADALEGFLRKYVLG